MVYGALYTVWGSLHCMVPFKQTILSVHEPFRPGATTSHVTSNLGTDTVKAVWSRSTLGSLELINSDAHINRGDSEE